MNGEIYNYESLCEQYGFDKAAMRTDCDVILALYDKFDGDVERTLTALHGVFAICIIDTRRNRVVVARDRIGIAPLYAGGGADGILAVAR